ncbi:MATE family efflux transporter [Pseudooceanicola sp. CBS1P-1]|uniref:MATE family efflux transporter n=1 Tax=Pseudooceanicola albus TaxID=2692189 RepID=A0A6L7FZE1_9RHOB|nr:MULTISPECIES: MATE family efflux transporter [Pseudooceanicola]MBT9382594.1 MATE family efflux transporter [Pseudooceanicola endophyticus]MXN17135.1 MATE family efflux transporter [Pseudooceanicola albus]
MSLVAPVRALTHGRVLRMALPVMLSNAAVPILGAVDTGVVGQLGQAAPIGAVGIGAIVLSSLYWLFGFLRMGTTGLTAHAAGAGDRGEVAALFTRAMVIGLAAGLVLIACQGLLFAGAFRLSPASEEVEGLARSYMSIRIYSAPAAIALFGVTGWLIAQERTLAVLAIQLGMTAVNLVLDLLFVLKLGWGLEGVAWASLLAEWGGLLAGLWLCREVILDPAARHWPVVFDRARLLRMGLVNRDILLRSLMLQVVNVSFMFLGAHFGDVQLAANQVLMQFMMIISSALDGFAFAAEAMVGQAMGRRDRPGLRRSVMLSGTWGVVTSLGLGLVFALAGGAIIDLMTTAPEVRAAARHFLPWIVILPLAGVGAFMMDGVFVGATRARDMRDMMALSVLIYLGAAAALVPLMGNHGLWAAYVISFLARGVTLAWRYPALEAEAV